MKKRNLRSKQGTPLPLHPPANVESLAKQSSPDKFSPKKPKSRRRFFIVGVGASAGGFEGFVELLKHLPAETGVAFVLVQHLDLSHPSKLSELLAHATPLPVEEVKGRTKVRPDHVYVMPPNRSMIIRDGSLHLQSRKKSDGQYLPVNQFFRSLAEERGSRAVGVVLSGTGADGTLGLKEIKAQGGITFAQDAKSAKYGEMPGSACMAGWVDFALPPEAISRAIVRVSRQAQTFSPVHEERDPPLAALEREFATIFPLLRSLAGVDFSSYKPNTLRRRVTRRMVLQKFTKPEDYVKYLQGHPEEVDALFQDFLINVTGFFRDASVFEKLKRDIFPKLLRNKPPDSPIRIWVPGCSTGEEVYSMAMVVLEVLGKSPKAHVPLQIFGTDISEIALSKARTGVYPEAICSEVSPERLRRFFEKVDAGYQIAKQIRDACVFARQDVAKDPPFSKVDLISCRNLLIYLGPLLQRKVMPVFHYALNPGGYLLLGTSETIGLFSELFRLKDKSHKIYLKKPANTRPEVAYASSSATPGVRGRGNNSSASMQRGSGAGSATAGGSHYSQAPCTERGRG